MNSRLADISATGAPGAHASVIPVGAGQRMSKTMEAPDNITSPPLPPYSP